MAGRSKVAKARAANLRKANAARKASAGSAPPEPAEEAEVAQPPQKKRKTNASAPAEPSAQSNNTAGTALPSVIEKPVVPTKNVSAPAPVVPPPAATSITNASAVAPAVTASVGMPSSGSFCLYNMSLPFLKEALVSKAGTKNYAALLAKLLELQLKPDRTAQAYVHFPSGGGKGYGRFRSRNYGFSEPMGDEPYDIGIAGLREEGRVMLTGLASAGADIKGVVGTAMLAESDCGVSSAQGEFKMRTVPVWKSGDGEIY
ncbi:hypothetical protein FPV67DRAFT_313246 [Lyophyllum atratum]|nr:hypothetical protein FPV67DRAFT_313246 [Lyophyllum atratum]